MSLSRRSLGAPARTLAVALLAGGLLAGCAGGEAATVSGHTVTDRDATVAAEQYAQMSGQAASLTGVVNALAQAEVFLPVMAQHGLTPGRAQVEEYVASQGWQMPADPLADSTDTMLRSMAAFQMVYDLSPEEQTQLAQDLNEALGREHVEVNPRYALTPDRFPVLPTWITPTGRAAEGAQTAPAGQ